MGLVSHLTSGEILLSKIFQAKGDQGNETEGEAHRGHTIAGVCESLN